MLFRYDFNNTLDLSKFKIQALRYIGQMRQLDYDFVLPNYKLFLSISTPDGSNSHMVTCYITESGYNEDGEIEKIILLYPLNDIRFRNFSSFKEIWTDPHASTGKWTSNSVENSINKICLILQIIHKINNLKAFL